MKTNLRRCPFCGSHPEVHREGTRGYSCVIGCTNCGCKLESNEIGYGEEWNRRCDDTPISARAMPEIVPSIAEELEEFCPRCAGSGEVPSYESDVQVSLYRQCPDCQGVGM